MNTTKKLLLPLLLIATPLCSQSHQETTPPTLLTKTHVLAQAQLTSLAHYIASKKEELLDDLDFFNSKEIDFDLSLVFSRLKLHYKGRWGYKGAGDPRTPFTGFKGTFTVPVRVAKGLTVNPLQADAARAAIKRHNLERFLNVSPTDEFTLKLVQLFLSLSREEITTENFSLQMRALLARAAITPSFNGLEYQGWRIVGTKEKPGYLDALFGLPQKKINMASAWLVNMVRTIAPLVGLSTKEGDPHAIKKLLASISFDQDQELIFSSNDNQLMKVTFGYHGVGNVAAPMSGCLLTVSIPLTPALGEALERVENYRIDVPENFTFMIPLNPTYECLLKVFMLLSSTTNGTTRALLVPQELEALLHRLVITPQATDFKLGLGRGPLKGPFNLIGTPEEPGLLRILADRAHEIMSYDFDTTSDEALGLHDAGTLLIGIAYKAVMDYQKMRLAVRDELAQTPEGEQCIERIAQAMTEHEAHGTAQTKQELDDALAAYRSLELAHAKPEIERICSFVMTQLARGVKRVPTSTGTQGLLSAVPLFKEFEDHGIAIGFDDFWQELSGTR